MTGSYQAWFEKYRPRELKDLIFPNENIKRTIEKFYNQGFIQGNILSHGAAGLGKTSLNEVLIHRIIKNPNDIFILERKITATSHTVDDLKRWLQHQPIGKQKIVKIEEIDRLSREAVATLKDGMLEKHQHNTSFLATTNHLEKVDTALLTRFNTKINFEQLPLDEVRLKLKFILEAESIKYNEEDLKKYIDGYHRRGLRDLINNMELASISGSFNLEALRSFSGSSENEDLIISYIKYFVRYLESKTAIEAQAIIRNPKSDPEFFIYYEYMFKIFKTYFDLNFDNIYEELSNSESELDLTAKNIVIDYWQDLELKRFKSTHTISLANALMINVSEQKGK